MLVFSFKANNLLIYSSQSVSMVVTLSNAFIRTNKFFDDFKNFIVSVILELKTQIR